mmetsp:Transcript_13471/g.22953  ORF Transcript_13471/g.22953 Transcript_13471/m.22953 type:complete len:153 (+) Transcript_13471:201-659(+)|eukprot:CAMPEP_0183707024 /NCGR_PEP_ID=MMETSP0737-20130205/3715_1 /TAXON_ID=385413 /ORGANISM="Thalassiosira miniscula, Strain CCMP1093" /LENGTH=152 /DNA_ID=CAMNT_0025934593 /DNA_START=202 /DNA_END=660 /DNA_ORIENTATION=+
MVSIDVPPEYGWVILGASLGPIITSMYLSGFVMKARKDYDVQYPNLYAVPKYHDKADEFNRVQRGHQNFLENSSSYSIITLLGGLRHPMACAIGTIFYCLGSVLYMKGYMDTTLEVKTARHKKGGGIKYVGLITSLISVGKLGYGIAMATES